jgi:glycosyltransferase involved in cell wall biosynthesis
MRVVHVFKDYHPPTTGGVEQHMRLLCRGLARHVDVTVLVPSRTRRTVEERVDGVRVVRVAEFGRYASVPLCPSLPGRLRRLAPDLVHLHYPNPSGDLAYLLGAPAAPLVITHHADIVKQRLLLPLYRPVQRRLFARARRIVATSPEAVVSTEILAAHRDRCAVIPLGIELDAFALRPGEAEEVRALRAAGAPLVLFVGVLRYYKGLPVLLRAVARARRPLRVVIAGRGPERAALEAEARRLGVADRVSFAGEVSDARRRVLMHAADVFALPSIDRCEAFGLVQVEAMACGTPVVASDLPTGVRWVNRHETTGLLVPPGDAAALAAALDRLLADPALRARLGAAARARAAETFGAERMVADTLALYAAVLGAEATAGA